MEEAIVYLENVAAYADLEEFARHLQDLRWSSGEKLEDITMGFEPGFLLLTRDPERILAANFLLKYRQILDCKFDY